MESNASSIYNSPESRLKRHIFRWYHRDRIETFVDMIQEDRGVVLSVACGNGVMESEHLSERFDRVIGIDIKRSNVESANPRIDAVHSAVPPIPLKSNSIDVVTSLSSVEHFPNEKGFVEEVIRVLKPGGTFYVNMPIEVGIGGLIRNLGQNFVHPERFTSPDSWRRFFDYSVEELFKKCPRDKHGTNHKFYNYKYLKRDLRELFEDVEVFGWPVPFFESINLAYYARAELNDAESE